MITRSLPYTETFTDIIHHFWKAKSVKGKRSDRSCIAFDPRIVLEQAKVLVAGKLWLQRHHRFGELRNLAISRYLKLRLTIVLPPS